VSAAGFAAPRNSSPPCRSHNGVQKISEPKAHVECTAELTEWLAHRIGWARTRRVAQVCCVVVSKGCCDVSAPRETVFELSTALPPLSKLTIACTSCAFDVGDRPSCPWSRSENWPRSRQDNGGSAISRAVEVSIYRFEFIAIAQPTVLNSYPNTDLL